MLVKSIALLAVLAPAVLAQAGPYAQCGGKSYTGVTTCVSGYSCVYVSDWYSQCRPQVASPSPSPKSPSPSPSPSPKSPSPSPSPSPKSPSPSPSPSPNNVQMCTANGGQDTARVPGQKPRVVSKCMKPGQFALTFDDGPKSLEPQLLTLLTSLGVKGTFFLTSNMYVDASQAPYNGWIKNLYNAGHQIAQHTAQHKDLNTLSQTDVKAQLVNCENVINAIIGKKPAMMRPPNGNANTAVLQTIESVGISTVVLWNVDTGDWSHHNAAQAVQAVKTAVEKCPNGSSSIIALSHSAENSIIDYVTQVVPYLKSKGYTFVTLEECTGSPAYK